MTVTAPPRRRGAALLEGPLANRGTAFTSRERRELGLDGLLPPVVETLEQQAARAYTAFGRYDDDLARHVYLRSLQNTNEVLFYRLLVDHLEELLPIVYTPTVGFACQQFSHIYRRNRGLFLSYPQRRRLGELLRNRPNGDIDAIVVTDGERVLGIGDQGVGGLGIPIGKLSLYSAIGGIHPARTLPVVLDVGTNNHELLDDPEYIGWRHERIDGDAYFDFVERFAEAVERELPGTLLQWEDFATAHARPILDRYRDRLLTFNDDIHGTAAVVVGALAGAVRASGSRLRDQRVVMLGAGSAGIGVADMLRTQMVADGVPDAEARHRFFVVTKTGLLTKDRSDLSPEQRVYAQPADALAGWTRTSDGAAGLADVVANADPTILIGLSTAAGAFTEPIVRQMAAKTQRPIIFPLSNPTSRSEADPADLAHWTDGRVLVATGSPYPPLEIDGRQVPVAQCNNVFIFPAVGLGVVASRARRVTARMMQAAARALGELSRAASSRHASLLPPIEELRAAAVNLATAVAITAVEEGVAPSAGEAQLRARVAASQWTPAYAGGRCGMQRVLTFPRVKFDVEVTMTSLTKPVILGVLAVLALIASGCGDHPPQPIHAGPPGAYLDLNGLEYQVQIARELNPADPSDAPYLRGIPARQRDLGRDQEWLAVFLLVQNPGNRAARAANELYMKDTSDQVFRPITVGRANDYAYRGSVVPAGGQLPVPDSPASQDQSVDGALVLFKIENTTRQDVPLELVIRDTRARAVGSLDLDT